MTLDVGALKRQFGTGEGLGRLGYISEGQQAVLPADFLPGWLIGGVGVGLALPTVLSSATAGLAPQQASTGSAIVNMSRKIGAVLGISILVAVLAVGDPISAFRHAWWVVVGLAVAGAVAALRTTPTIERI